MIVKPTEEQRQQVKAIMDDCQQKLANVIGRPVNVIYRLKVNHLSPELIIQQVCATLRITYSQLVSKSQEKENVVGRHLVMWLVVHYCGYTHDKAGELVYRDGSNATKSIKIVNDMLEMQDTLYMNPLAQIEKLLLNIINDAA